MNKTINQDKGSQAERARHSPGPWKMDNRHRRDDTRVEVGGVKWLSSQRAVVDADGVIVAELHCWEYENPDTLHWYTEDKQAMLANARLVAAAPELLASLQECMEALRAAGLDELFCYHNAKLVVNAAKDARGDKN